jgi:hypothetical protein
MERVQLETALHRLGALLALRNIEFELAVLGGGALLLLGLIERPTRDLDAVALVDGAVLRKALQIASRFDQVHFKLYAAVDQGPDSKHADDLRRLRPTVEELEAAAAWCRQHDPSGAFAEQLAQASEYFGREDHRGDV